MKWQETALQASERSAEAMSQIADAHRTLTGIESTFSDWRKEQADKDTALTKQIASLEQTWHDEIQEGGKKDPNRQFIAVWAGIFVSGLLGLASLIVSILK